MENVKQCTKCKEIKSLDEFYSKEQYSKRRQEYYIKYTPECKECTKKRSRKWQIENPEAYQKIWMKTEQRPERKQTQRNKAKTKEMKDCQKQWQQENLEAMRIHNQNRRAMKKELIHDLTYEQWINCLDFFDHSCAYCCLSDDECKNKYNKILEQEHFIPITKGGGYTQINIIPACRGCNGSKYNFEFNEWYSKQEFYSKERENKIIDYFVSILRERNQINDIDCREFTSVDSLFSLLGKVV